MNRFHKAFNFAVLFYIFSGSLYFLYYLLQFNKTIYLLIIFLIYLISFSFRRFILKTEHGAGFTEVGIFFISMIFLAYTLYIFKLDLEIVNFLPDKLLVNSSAIFIFLLFVNMLTKEKSGKLKIITIAVLLGLVIFQDSLNLVIQSLPWVASLIIGTPYVYLLSILTGLSKFSGFETSN